MSPLNPRPPPHTLLPTAAQGLYYDMWQMQRAQAVLEEHLQHPEAQGQTQGQVLHLPAEQLAGDGKISSTSGSSSSSEDDATAQQFRAADVR